MSEHKFGICIDAIGEDGKPVKVTIDDRAWGSIWEAKEKAMQERLASLHEDHLAVVDEFIAFVKRGNEKIGSALYSHFRHTYIASLKEAIKDIRPHPSEVFYGKTPKIECVWLKGYDRPYKLRLCQRCGPFQAGEQDAGEREATRGLASTKATPKILLKPTDAEAILAERVAHSEEKEYTELWLRMIDGMLSTVRSDSSDIADKLQVYRDAFKKGVDEAFLDHVKYASIAYIPVETPVERCPVQSSESSESSDSTTAQ
jgi:hypothetical protein